VSSFRRIISSRANAALSTGPRTDAGKRRSSRNALRHGCRSRQVDIVLLQNESRNDFDTLLQDHLSAFQPRTTSERACVDRMAFARWRQRRIWALENQMWNQAIAALPAGQIEYDDDLSKMVAAYSNLCRKPGFAVLPRYEASCHQAYDRTFHQLLALQRNEPKNEICTNEATLCIPYVPPAAAGTRVDPPSTSMSRTLAWRLHI